MHTPSTIKIPQPSTLIRGQRLRANATTLVKRRASKLKPPPSLRELQTWIKRPPDQHRNPAHRPRQPRRQRSKQHHESRRREQQKTDTDRAKGDLVRPVQVLVGYPQLNERREFQKLRKTVCHTRNNAERSEWQKTDTKGVSESGTATKPWWAAVGTAQEQREKWCLQRAGGSLQASKLRLSLRLATRKDVADYCIAGASFSSHF